MIKVTESCDLQKVVIDLVNKRNAKQKTKEKEGVRPIISYYSFFPHFPPMPDVFTMGNKLPNYTDSHGTNNIPNDD
jgi:hypothetical protein